MNWNFPSTRPPSLPSGKNSKHTSVSFASTLSPTTVHHSCSRRTTRTILSYHGHSRSSATIPVRHSAQFTPRTFPLLRSSQRTNNLHLQLLGRVPSLSQQNGQRISRFPQHRPCLSLHQPGTRFIMAPSLAYQLHHGSRSNKTDHPPMVRCSSV